LLTFSFRAKGRERMPTPSQVCLYRQVKAFANTHKTQPTSLLHT